MSETGSLFKSLNILLPRFFRLIETEEISGLHRWDKSDIDPLLIQEVRWLPGFYCIPGYVPMSKVGNISSGIYAMDAASGVVVYALMGKSNTDEDIIESILDLCCCPGSKFQMMSECMKNDKGLIVGVDHSERRLQVIVAYFCIVFFTLYHF